MLAPWMKSYDQPAAAAKSLQSCPTLCGPIDGSPPGSPVPGILQARTLEWVAISFSNAWKRKLKVKSFSRVRLFVTPWTSAYQAPLSNLDSILKSRDITLPTKIHIVKAIIFPGVMYECGRWAIKRAFELWCWRRLLTVPWTARRSN